MIDIWSDSCTIEHSPWYESFAYLQTVLSFVPAAKWWAMQSKRSVDPSVCSHSRDQWIKTQDCWSLVHQRRLHLFSTWNQKWTNQQCLWLDQIPSIRQLRNQRWHLDHFRKYPCYLLAYKSSYHIVWYTLVLPRQHLVVTRSTGSSTKSILFVPAGTMAAEFPCWRRTLAWWFPESLASRSWQLNIP